MDQPASTVPPTVKEARVADLAVGQTIIIDTGANIKNAVVAIVETPGATTVGTATTVGATVIPAGNAAGSRRYGAHHASLASAAHPVAGYIRSPSALPWNWDR